MHIHFVGNNGVSMRALEQLAASFGNTVTGSDAATTGHDPKNIAGADRIVYTNAVKPDNCELVAARAAGIPVTERAAYLGEIAQRFKTVIAIAGCHGKTTATAMTGKALRSLFPTVHAGVEGGSHIGKRDVFVTEACEYNRSFLHLKPDIGIVLNVGYDHPDCYRTEAELIDAYKAFCAGCKTVVVNGDDRVCRTLSPAYKTFGLSAACDYSASRIAVNGGLRAFTYRHENTSTRVRLNVTGAHNIYNALAALTAADLCGVDIGLAADGLAAFCGVKRRFESRGTVHGKAVICDYAHHPDEIRATIAAAKELFPSVAVVFQPHTYSRTEAMLKEFASALAAADTVALTPIFAARENPTGITSRELLKEIARINKNAYLFDSFEETAGFCAMTEEPAVIFMGAGDIDRACDMFIKGT